MPKVNNRKCNENKRDMENKMLLCVIDDYDDETEE